jgi:hypothetical protein
VFDKRVALDIHKRVIVRTHRSAVLVRVGTEIELRKFGHECGPGETVQSADAGVGIGRNLLDIMFRLGCCVVLVNR